MRTPFELGKVKNSNDWTKLALGEYVKVTKDVNIIDNSSYPSASGITSSRAAVSFFDSTTISRANSEVGEISQEITINLYEYEEGSQNRVMYYLIINSEGSVISLGSSDDVKVISNGTASFNRTVYILRRISIDSFVVYKELKDMYAEDEPDLDSEDFSDWECTAG